MELNYKKGEWKVVNGVNNIYVKVGYENIADCYKNRGNAKLIQKAPEMYEGLKTFLELIKNKDTEGYKKQRKVLIRLLIELETKE